MKITNPFGPNTTVLLPGSCNAHCDFCFWNRETSKIAPPSSYIEDVFGILTSLPKTFRVLSVSGGEPTLSPYFGRFLSRLGVHRRTHRLERVVLTTHGGNLRMFLSAVGCVVDHINISRHAIGTDNNFKVFKTQKVPSDIELQKLITEVHETTSCDVTLNCVVQPLVTQKFCYDFIEYAKSLGADAVSFRKVASTVTPTRAETAFVARHGFVDKSDCPVCRGLEQRVDGFPVRWKGSVPEPSLTTGGVYEVVIQPDGKAYSDWAMTSPLLLKKEVQQEGPKVSRILMKGNDASSISGCGGSVISGCGHRSSSRSGCGVGGSS